MKFTDLRTNDYVMFNRNIKYTYFKLEEDFLWVNEPLDCMLEVKPKDYDTDDIELTCVNGCGSHYKLDFSEEEYDEMSGQLNMDLLTYVNMAEAFDDKKRLPEIPMYEMTVDDNIDYISKLLQRKA